MINLDSIHIKIWSEEIGRGWIIFKDGSYLALFEEGKNSHRDVAYKEAERLISEKKKVLESIKKSNTRN